MRTATEDIRVSGRFLRSKRESFALPCITMALFPLFAFTLAFVLYLIAIKVFPMLGILDFPERYGFTRPRLPYPTGIISVACFIVIFLFLENLTMQSIGILIGIVLLGIFA